MTVRQITDRPDTATITELPMQTVRGCDPQRFRGGHADWLAAMALLKEVEVRYDDEIGALWHWMAPGRRPSFTLELLDDMTRVLDLVERAARGAASGMGATVRYLVLGSRIPGIFNLGGDLELFGRLIEARDRDGLRHYAHLCVAGQHRRMTSLDLPLHTICLIQGDALGGGFEAALSHDVIVAERGTKFGLPEVLFNMFPGMGAYSFLSRRLDPARAQRMILSGRLYTAEELHATGVVDILAQPGDGAREVERYIRQHARFAKAHRTVAGIRRMLHPIDRDELFAIVDLWVETALTLEPSDLRKMRHLRVAQDRRWASLTPGSGGTRDERQLGAMQ